MDKKIGLGKGLSALMGEDLDITPATPVAGIITVSLADLVPSPFQPRRLFTEEALTDLVESIREKGVLQPLLVRTTHTLNARYEIIAGERRYRASKLAGLSEVPVIVKEFDDQATLEVALIENLQREDLSPLEEAEGYKRLLQEFDYTQDALAKVVGKSRSHVANMMRLLDLPITIKHLVENKQLTTGHARALLNAENAEALAEEIIQKGLNVRQAEKLVTSKGGVAGRKNAKTSTGVQKLRQKDSDIAALENELGGLLNAPVSINWNGKKGQVVVQFASLEILDVILQRLTNGGALEG